MQQPPYVLIHSSKVSALIARLTLFSNKETLHQVSPDVSWHVHWWYVVATYYQVLRSYNYWRYSNRPTVNTLCLFLVNGVEPQFF